MRRNEEMDAALMHAVCKHVQRAYIWRYEQALLSCPESVPQTVAPRPGLFLFLFVFCISSL